MSRMEKGWALTKKSWSLMREHRGLIRFPLCASLVTLTMLIVTFVPGVYLIAADKSTGAGVLVMVAGVYLAVFVAIYFSVALAAATDLIFRGQQAGFVEGLSVARHRAGTVAGWAALSIAIAPVLGMLEQAGAIAVQIGGYALDVAWSLIRALAIPVIAIEGTGPIDTMERATDLVRTRWAAQVTGDLAITAGFGLLGFAPGILLTVAGLVLWGSNGIDSNLGAAGAACGLVGITLLVISSVLSRALVGVFSVALYRFAADGEAVGAFSVSELESAARVRQS
jgi:hypothetical protein